MSAVRRAAAISADHPLAVIVALALAVRLVWILATAGYAPSGDAIDFHLHGVSLAEEGRYPPSALAEPGSPSAFRPPAYPYLLGGVYALVGATFVAGRVAGAALGAISVWLLFHIALELWGRRPAIAAGVLGSVYPPFVLMSGVLLSENLFIPLVLGMVLACLKGSATGDVRWWAAAGGLAASAALTRSNGLVMLALAVGAAAWVGVRSRRPLAPMALVAGTAIMFLAPWTLRNLAAFDALLPFSAQSGYTIAGVYNSTAAVDGPTQAAARLSQFLPEHQALFRREGIDEAELDGTLRARAIDFAVDNPRYALEAARINLLRTVETGGDPSFRALWDAERDGVGARRVAWVGGFWALAALALAAVAAPASRRLLRSAPSGLWLVPLLLLLTTVPLNGKPRYRLVVDPFLVLAASTLPATRRRADPP